MMRGGRAGFTLMELVIAIAITGAATAVGYGAFASLVDHRRTLDAATAETEAAAALRETLHEWITYGMVMPQVGGTPPLGAAASQDRLMMRTAALTPSRQLITLVELFIEDDPATEAEGLTMRYQGTVADTMMTRELAPQITELEVAFLDLTTNRWYPASEAATIQPIAVQITLGGSGEWPLPPLLQLPIRVMIRDDPTRRPG